MKFCLLLLFCFALFCVKNQINLIGYDWLYKPFICLPFYSVLVSEHFVVPTVPILLCWEKIGVLFSLV
ncbi:hypothetical protein RchiOBHm_Chr3g0497251 [Rosa chinensis]|uniref:Uncharacterized protein n=1 Tax=Rosa chinensis TaxID=74649 RepID=A0A2P6RHP3_ROSCH|nr:hypothetical protein RchiOBHm_Chr3g0497251 [Rosa chinensis]